VNINRRIFLSDTGLSAAGLMIGTKLTDFELKENAAASSYDIMQEALKYRKIDSHIHLYLYPPNTDTKFLLDYADRLGIEKLVISLPVVTMDDPHQAYVDANNRMIKALKEAPDRFIAQFTLNTGYGRESLEEIKRCADQGMVGLKAYYHYKLNDPLFYPVIEKMIDLKMIILMHSFAAIGRGGYRPKYGNPYPNESTPEDFAEVAERYPEALLQFAHTGGGGDWEYECKILKHYPNIFVDLSGSNNEGNMVNHALSTIGEDRLFFGSDNSYYQGVSNILSADLTEVQRKKIFFDNYNNILKRGGYNVD